MVTYPFIRFVCRYGRVLSFLATLLSMLLSIALAYHTQSFAILFIGSLASLTLGALLRLVSEIVEVVADALLPR